MRLMQILYKFFAFISGVDFYNVLDGPSNGFELLKLFDKVHQEHQADRSAVLERGDCIVMDNCGFHHGHRIEPVLRDMLADCGVRLLFQPLYSLHFNTCEYCFNEIKEIFTSPLDASCQ